MEVLVERVWQWIEYDDRQGYRFDPAHLHIGHCCAVQCNNVVKRRLERPDFE